MAYEMLQGTRAPVRMWADPASVEPDALAQLRNVASLPWTRQVAVMPDVHYGKGATVGSVIAMEQAISPAAVGVDIGCGMSAVRSSITASQLPDNLSGVRAAIEDMVPVGWSAHDRPVRPPHGTGGWPQFWEKFRHLHEGVRGREDRARQQMGTLGGGNHFIELCVEQGGADDGRVWLMLHSGSRNIGKELAERHMATARKLPHNQDLPDRDLAVFLTGTPEMSAYRRDLFWAQEYAARNRSTMLQLCLRALSAALDGLPLAWGEPDLLPPQLRGRGSPRWSRGPGDPQGCHQGGQGRAGHHPRLHGHRLLHRGRPGQPGCDVLGVARRWAAHVPQAGEADLRRGGPRRADSRRGMPQRPGGDR